MASNKPNRTGGKLRPGAPNGRSAAVDDMETGPVREPEDDRDEREDDDDDESQASAPRSVPYAPRTERPSVGFFDVYRPGQGGKVRLGTFVMAALFVLWGAAFIYE